MKERSYGFETTEGWEINDNYIFSGWTITFNICNFVNNGEAKTNCSSLKHAFLEV